MKSFLLRILLLLSTFSLSLNAQELPSTSFTRTLLRAQDAAMARTLLGISGGESFIQYSTNNQPYVYSAETALWYPIYAVTNSGDGTIVLALGQSGVGSTNWNSTTVTSAGSLTNGAGWFAWADGIWAAGTNRIASGGFIGDGRWLTNVTGTVSNYASDYYASSRPVFVREPVRPLGHAAGRTLPPMGYAPWNTFACNVSQNGLSNQMRWMIDRGLRTAGYTNTVSIDDGWQTGRDGDGKPTVDATRYPLGFQWLTDWALTNGFRMTVWTPADNWYNNTNPAITIGSCGTNFQHGSGGYELTDAWWYATNGFKSIKYDYFGYAGDLVATSSNFWWAVNQTGSNLPIDSVGYAAPFYSALIDYCSTLRVARDIRPTWAYVQYQVDEMDKNAKYQRPGFWPHPDMMVVGVTNAYGSLSTHEAVSHFGLWCIMGAPLIIGADCSTLSATLNTLLTNAAYIAVDQDPLCAQGRRVKSELVPTGDLQTWVKPLGSYNSGTNAVLLLNNSDAPAYIYVYFDEIGLGTNCSVRDLTTPADRGQQTEFYREYLASHQSVLLKITGTPRQGVTLTATPRAMLYNTMSNVFLAGTFRGDARMLTNYSTTNLIGSYVGDGGGLTNLPAAASYTNNATRVALVTGLGVGTNLNNLTLSNLTATGTLTLNNAAVIASSGATKTIPNATATSVLTLTCPTNSSGGLFFDYSITSSGTPGFVGTAIGRLAMQLAHGAEGIKPNYTEFGGTYYNVAVSGTGLTEAATPAWTFTTNANTSVTLWVNFQYEPSNAPNTNLFQHVMHVMNVQNLSTNVVTLFP